MEKQKEIVTGSQLLQYASINCETPRFVTTRTGKRIAVPCGSCIACLRKRRNSWSVRLQDEAKHPRCVDCFGITLTYTNANIPNLPVEVLKNQTYTYKEVSKNKFILAVDRGCDNCELQNCSRVSLAYPKDIEDYIKRLRKHFSDYYPDYFIRYYIASDYGEVDGKRTGRAHYHGEIFVFANDWLTAQKFRHNPRKGAMSLAWRELAMDKWPYCERIYNAKKNIYIGKDYHTIDNKYHNYLGKYINKYQDTGAIGRLFVDTRCYCSRQSAKHALGSIGYSAFLENNQQYYQYLITELDRCIKFNERFNPQQESNPLNGCYRKKLFEQYFGFKFSRLAKWIEYKNYNEKVGQCTTLQSSWEIDPNDPFELLTIETLKIHTPTINKRVNPARKRNSIIHPPKDWFSEPYKEFPIFTPTEICAFCRYINFANKQLDLYIGKFQGKGKFLVSDWKIMRWLGEKGNNDKLTRQTALSQRKKQLAEIERLKQFADDYAHYHEKTNGYLDY